MDPLEEISYLSEKGYDFLEQGNFIAAKTYFMDAYTIVQKLNGKSDSTQQIKLEEVANSLITLAQEAHTLNFRNDTNLFPQAQPMKHQKTNGRKNRRKKRGKSIKIYLAESLEKDREIIWKPADLMNGITTITGGSGSGKTQTIKRIVSELTENKIPTIIMDLHRSEEHTSELQSH